MYSIHKMTLPGMKKTHHHEERWLTVLLSTFGIAESANLSIDRWRW
jgi:hypothetical protein